MNEPAPLWFGWIVGAATLLLFGGLFVLSLRQRRMDGAVDVPAWANASTDCFNAYIKRNYVACVSAGMAALAVQFIWPVGLVTILALRRLDRANEAELLSRALLEHSFGPSGIFLLLMRVLDGDLDTDQFLKEGCGPDGRIEVTPDLECQFYFYFGAKLVTEAKFDEAMRPLFLAVVSKCDALERSLADADLKTVIEQRSLHKVR